MTRALIRLLLVGLCFAGPLAAQTLAGPQDAGATPATPPAADGDCVEHVPSGKARPELKESFPSRGTSGHASSLVVVVEHGKGETVLPGGLPNAQDGANAKSLERARFFLPHPDGGAGPRLSTETKGERSTTTLDLPLVPLPEKPGRTELVLPPLPIAVARASGEVLTVCTKPHRVVVEDPIANTPDPKPNPNPAPRAQREVWTTAKHVAIAGLIALVVGALLAFLVGRWLRRPKPAVPPPPPRPPWEVALEELFDTRHAGLIKAERYAEHFDRVSDSIRKYLGARYGFDGLESTTREAVAVLRAVTPALEDLPRIEAFLRQADLVKFARSTPSEQECEHALLTGEDIVRRTMPAAQPLVSVPRSELPPPPPADSVQPGGDAR